MGSRGYTVAEEPQHTVVVPPIEGRRDRVAFWMAEQPVTQRQLALWTGSADYTAWCEARGQSDRHANRFGDRPEAPADSVTWFEARGYCAWLRSRVWGGTGVPGRLPSVWQFDLPTEVEWEYACRAGTATEYWSGDGAGALAEVGRFGEGYEAGTKPVSGAPANDFGLRGMHGAIWQWCLDSWDETAYRTRLDGAEYSGAEARVAAEQAASMGDRMVRGGSWGYSAWWSRSSYRGRWGPFSRGGYLGFRVCLCSGPGGPSCVGQGAEWARALTAHPFAPLVPPRPRNAACVPR